MVVEFLYCILYFLRKCTPIRIGLKIKKIFERKKPINDNTSIDCMLEMVSDTSQINKLVLKKETNPCVSIIIPAYNQFAYTYNCIRSVITGTKNIPYEIILADDNSTDETKDIEKYVKNIVVSRTPYNMQFLRNCNRASKRVSGKYIFFLNNDTQIANDCISALVSLLEKDENIGMVGAKLVYPDGRLQEAGGIVWKDGTASNYGNQDDPYDSAYNYVKEVDYISGAAVMIRKSLWEEIGGFDDRFYPAYYEDTDLAFEVRKRGYKVVYQPAAQVVHFEGVSNGINVYSGYKRYQIFNERKFFSKWKCELKQNHFPYGRAVFLARDRGMNRMHILLVGHLKENRTREHAQEMLREMTCQIVFLNLDTSSEEINISSLGQMGICVIVGMHAEKECKRWIRKNIRYFDQVVLDCYEHEDYVRTYIRKKAKKLV